MAQLTDDFSDGNFTSNPTWSGDATLFTIESNQLRSSSPTGATYHLSTPSTKATNAQWEFFINLQLGTSGVNFVEVWLTSDVADLNNANNGYFVRIGDTDDLVALYRMVGGTETLLTSSPSGVVNSTSNNPFRVRVTRNASNVWTLAYDDGDTGSFVTATTTPTDNSVTTSSFFGVSIAQSSAASAVNSHFFDDFVVGDIVADGTPPSIASINIISATQIEVLFSEAVATATAQNTSNYSVNNGIGNPSNATRDGSDQRLVRLTFGNSFSNGQSNVLTVNNVADLAGNAIGTTQESFTFTSIGTAANRDVIINEIMADPTPEVGLPNSEFVELYNRSTNSIDLQNYTLNGRTITTGNYLLAPDAYVLLCPAANAGEFTGNVIGMPSFDGLSNAGETVTLRDEDNARDIDVVSYTDDWYKDNTKDDGGFTLALINPTLVCSGENNWRASDDASGGTPAQQNSVLNNLPDTQNPIIQSAIVTTDNQLTVTFNEVFQEADLQGASYSTNNGLLVTSVAPQNNNQEVLITFNSNLTVGVIYTLTISGLADCAGNPLTENQVAFGSGASPTFQQVIITEIMADPDPVVGLPELEYIEIYNTTDQVLQLAGCQLTDGSGSATFPNFNLLPNTYLIVCTTGNVDELQSFGDALGVSNFPSLTNSGKQLTLFTTGGRTMFTVTYSDNWYRDDVKQEGGYSLEMIDVQAPCVGSLNWIGSESPTGGTPGQPNSIQESRADNMPPQLLRADAIDEGTIILQFDEQMDSLSLVQATYSFDPAVSLQVVAPESPDFTQVTLKTTELLAIQTTYQVTVEDVSDCSGNGITTDNTAIFGVPEQAVQGDIILNEILFNPRTGGSDFVELYNNSDKFIDLQNWQLANTENDEIDDRRLITEENYILPPGSYVAITEDVEDVRSNYPNSVDKPFLETSSLPSYNDDEGSVVLIDNLNEEVQRFDYEEDFHFDLIDDEEGVSLERISFMAPVNDPNSWFSAASTAGFATPGAENSQQRREGQAVGGINVSPKAFVPDNDGFSDFTTIDYSFTQGGYVANVSIYDNQGREIKRLAQNQLLATSGFFTWDGTNEERARVRTGYYLLFFQIFDLSGNEEVFKETIAVTERF